VLRSHLRAILAVTVAALVLVGCMPNSSGPSIPTIPTSSADITPVSDPPVTTGSTPAIKKFGSRRPPATQAVSKTRAPDPQ
jgi:hypothetical protein